MTSEWTILWCDKFIMKSHAVLDIFSTCKCCKIATWSRQKCINMSASASLKVTSRNIICLVFGHFDLVLQNLAKLTNTLLSILFVCIRLDSEIQLCICINWFNMKWNLFLLEITSNAPMWICQGNQCMRLLLYRKFNQSALDIIYSSMYSPWRQVIMMFFITKS